MDSVPMPVAVDRAGARSSPPDRLGRLWPDVAVWCAFAVVAVWLRGVRWDETYECAQAMTRAVPYPEGHPLLLYTRRAFSGQYYASALLYLVSDDPAFFNGVRNLAFVLATVLPPFLLAATLSGSALAGHVCVVLVLLGVHLDLDDTYPQFLWPEMYSTGHIGTAFALVIAALLARGRVRTAALLGGLMPFVHLGQFPPVLLLLGVWFVQLLRDGKRAELARTLPFFAAGLLLCVAFYFVQRSLSLPVPDSGPYASAADAHATWEAGLANDRHRRLPAGGSHVAPVVLALIVLFGRTWRGAGSSAWRWITAYAAGVCAIVYGVMLAHLLLGAHAPYALIGWLPYRLANHLPPVLVAMVVTLLLRRAALGRGILALALVLLAARALFPVHLLPGAAAIFMALAGAAVVSLPRRDAVSAVMAQKPRPARGDLAIAGLLVALAAACLWQEWRGRAHLTIGPFERRLTALLHESHEEDALLVGPPAQLLLQAKTGHPVMSDMAMPFHGGYMPALAPVVHKLYSEVYGIDLGVYVTDQPFWTSRWSRRTPEEWRALGAAYGFRYVVVPATLSLPLELVLEDQTTLWNRTAARLYRIG